MINSRIPSLATLEEGTIDPGNSTQYSKPADDNDITSHRGTLSEVGLYDRRTKKRHYLDPRYALSSKS